jgi:hypothetical protein
MDPDPLVRGTDPGIRIRIRAKLSRIPNTALVADSGTGPYLSTEVQCFILNFRNYELWVQIEKLTDCRYFIN